MPHESHKCLILLAYFCMGMKTVEFGNFFAMREHDVGKTSDTQCGLHANFKQQPRFDHQI